MENNFNLSLDPEELKRLISLSKDADLPPINLTHYKLDSEILKLIPEEIAKNYQVLPLAKLGSVLTVAMADPFEVFTLDNLKVITNCNIQPVVAMPGQIKQAQNQGYRSLGIERVLTEEFLDQISDDPKDIEWKTAVKEETADVNAQEISRISQDSAIINLVNNIILEASKCRASDIHIEPYADTLRLRLRVDGILRESANLPRDKADAIIARVKLLSGLDITQHRLPQDGRFSMKLENRQIDFRVSLLPGHFGEKAVLRLLDKANLTLDLDKLGYSENALEAFKKAVTKPHGMILLTGPTGSGKTTTLYALLNRLNVTNKHLVTVEDPIEYQLKGLTQIQVKPEIGLTFAGGLRAILRQSPDVIMVGEIRDTETVDIAMKTALTGHIILSTLHTNDAVSAIIRLMDMGVEPFLIAMTLNLVAAQRLLRKICPHCREKYEASTEGISGLPEELKNTKTTFYRGKGCVHCGHSGYLGRIAVVEAFFLDETLRQMILKKANMIELKNYARKFRGMKTLREEAMERGLKGEVSLEEIVRVTPEG